MYISRKIKIWTLLLPLVLLSTKCDTTGGYQIPYVTVELHINIVSELGSPSLNSITLINGGVNGLLIYQGYEYGDFHVFDRTCTLYPEHNEAVVEDEDFKDILFTCPVCNSKYLLPSADPTEGPATFPLHEYRSVVEGDLLHVYN